MLGEARFNPTGRFDGLAAGYDRFRPTYPDSLFDFLETLPGCEKRGVVADVGCGTGISSRQLAARGWRVVGVEPNADMRAVAEMAANAVPGDASEFRAGSAEATGLADGSCRLVLAAQAFHWFRPVEAFAEFHRILVDGGWVALVWNAFDRSDPFTDGYVRALAEVSPDREVAAATQDEAGRAIFATPLFTDAAVASFPNAQVVDEEGLLGRAFSASYGPKDAVGKERLAARLMALFAECQHSGWAALQYRTVVYHARKS
jgi:SAM-dependent methyltransferase